VCACSVCVAACTCSLTVKFSVLFALIVFVRSFYMVLVLEKLQPFSPSFVCGSSLSDVSAFCLKQNHLVFRRCTFVLFVENQTFAFIENQAFAPRSLALLCWHLIASGFPLTFSIFLLRNWRTATNLSNIKERLSLTERRGQKKRGWD